METGECKRTINDDGDIQTCRINEKYLVTGSIGGRLKIWDLEAVTDFGKDESHPFLVQTIENLDNNVFLNAVDDFQIVGSSLTNYPPRVNPITIVIWDFLPSST